MSRRTRRHHELPFSLFSFQDIVAAVTGVVLLLTLILMLELILRQPSVAEAAPGRDEAELRARLEEARERLLASSAAPSEEEVARLRQTTASLEQLLAILREQDAAAASRIAELEQDLQRRRAELDAVAVQTAELRRQAELERATTRVTLLEGDRGGHTTWFIECAAGDVRIGRINDDGLATLVHRFDSSDEARRWALTRPRDQDRFVLLVRPDGVEAFDDLQEPLRAAGYGVGWDLWAESIRLFQPLPNEERGDASAK